MLGTRFVHSYDPSFVKGLWWDLFTQDCFTRCTTCNAIVNIGTDGASDGVGYYADDTGATLEVGNAYCAACNDTYLRG